MWMVYIRALKRIRSNTLKHTYIYTINAKVHFKRDVELTLDYRKNEMKLILLIEYLFLVFGLCSSSFASH